MGREVKMSVDELLLVSEAFNLAVFINKTFYKRKIDGFIDLSYDGCCDGMSVCFNVNGKYELIESFYFGWDGDKSLFRMCQILQELAEKLVRGDYDDAKGSGSETSSDI